MKKAIEITRTITVTDESAPRPETIKSRIIDAIVDGLCEGIKALASKLWAIIIALMIVLCPNPAQTADTHDADVDANDRVCAYACCADDNAGDEDRTGIEQMLKRLKTKLDDKSYDILTDALLGAH